jgi:hypothetical protein
MWHQAQVRHQSAWMSDLPVMRTSSTRPASESEPIGGARVFRFTNVELGVCDPDRNREHAWRFATFDPLMFPDLNRTGSYS